MDVALVWGPLAGFFSSRSKVPLRLEPVTPTLDGAQWPMALDISVGVRRTHPELRERIETQLTQEQPAIDVILQAYSVPRL